MDAPSQQQGSQQKGSREVEFFDQFVAEHGDYDVLAERAYDRILDAFKASVRPRAGERCIDLGCGTGAFTRRLLPFGLQLGGMDISPGSIKLAQGQTTGIDFRVGDITATGLPDGCEDIVCYSGVLHHFTTRDSRVRVLTEGRRLLAPGGRLFAFDPSVQSPSMFLYRDPRSPLYSKKGKTDNEVLLHRSELAGELRDAGFVDLEIRGIGGIAYRYVESKLAGVILPLYNLYEELIRWSPFEDRLGTFLITVARKN
jgi:SAM-dependent methyltransferase